MEKFIVDLSATQLSLLKYLLVVCTLIFIFWTGIVFGSVFLSVIFRISGLLRDNRDYTRFSQELLNSQASMPLLWLIFALLPYAIISFIFLEFYYSTDFSLFNYLMYGAILLIGGYLFIFVYKKLANTGKNMDFGIGIGFLSVLFLIGCIHFYSSVTALSLEPEKWLFLNRISKGIFNWAVVSRLVYTLSLMLAIAGSWILLQYSKSYRHGFLENFIPVFIIATLVPQPILLLWNMLFIPYTSLSINIIVITALIFLLIAYNTFYSLKIMEIKDFSKGGRISAILLMVIILFSINDLIARDKAKEDQALNLKPLMEKMMVEEVVAVKERGTITKGEDVFKRICSGCHSFERRVVGPALNSVVTGYRDKKSLMEFIKNPVKKSPDFPQMPALGLSDEELSEVADYLMEQVKR